MNLKVEREWDNYKNPENQKGSMIMYQLVYIRHVKLS